MSAAFDDNRFICSCTAEIIALTGLDPAACRAFARDFTPLFRHLARRGVTPRRAVRNGVVLGWAATLADRDAQVRSGRSCRQTETVGRAICTVVLREAGADPRLARLARAALARASAATARQAP